MEVVMERADGIEVVVVMKEATMEVVAVADVEGGVVKMEFSDGNLYQTDGYPIRIDPNEFYRTQIFRVWV